MEPQVLLTRLLVATRKRGAKAAEALLTESEHLLLRYQQDEVAPADPRRTHTLDYTVYLPGGRKAKSVLHYDNFDEVMAIMEESIDQALARASLANTDPLEGPSDRFDVEERGLCLLDRRLANLQLADRRDLLQENALACRAVHDDLRLDVMRYQETIRTRSFASTRGVSVSERSSTFSLIGTATHSSSGRSITDGVASRYFANVASIPIGFELGQRLALLHREAPLPEQPQALILSPRVSAQLLRAIAPAFTAPGVRDGESFIHRFIGKRIAAQRLHVIDDPGLPGAYASRAFDDRGVPPAPVVMIREGKASGLFFDTYSARIANTRPTGHFMDGALRPSNLIMRPGTRSRNAIGMDLSDYLVLDAFTRDDFLDIRTGMIDCPADFHVFRDNKVVGSAQRVPMRISIRRLLSAIVEVAGDQSRFGAVDSCSVVLRGIEIPTP